MAKDRNMGFEKSEFTRRNPIYIAGDKLVQRMTELGWDEARLAAKAKVCEQTVRNYQDSTPNDPHKVGPKIFHRVCTALGVVPSELTLTLQMPEATVLDRFLADPEKALKIAGKWNAVSEDLEIPGFISYTSPIPWHGQVVIETKGNQFKVHGVDKDGDCLRAEGVLLEGGNWLCFHYLIQNERLREYGTSLVNNKGDGKTIEGIFVGRDAGHSNIGLVVAKLTLTKA